MTQFDLRTQAWLEDIGLYCGGNTYNPAELREVLANPSEWSERLKHNFQHVMAVRSLTALDYDEQIDIDFENDEELYAYLQRLYGFLFNDGPFPEWS